MFSLTSLEPIETSFPLQGECAVNLTIVNNLLKPVTVSSIGVAVVKSESSDLLNQSHSSSSSFKRKHSRDASFSARSRHSSTSSAQEVDIYGPDTVPPSAAPAELDMATQWERTVNQTVVSTSVVCKTPLKRLNSGQDLLKDRDMVKADYSQAMVSGETVLQPGENNVVLTGSVSNEQFFRVRILQALPLELFSHPFVSGAIFLFVHPICSCWQCSFCSSFVSFCVCFVSCEDAQTAWNIFRSKRRELIV